MILPLPVTNDMSLFREGTTFPYGGAAGKSLNSILSDMDGLAVFHEGMITSSDISFTSDIVDSMVQKTFQNRVITDTMYLNVTAPVTANISLPPSNPLNPTSATVISNGTYLYQNVSTDPLSQPDAPNLADVDMITVSLAVGPTTLCHCKSLRLSLTYDGGTFAVESDVTLGNIGTVIHIGGIPCFIDKTGYVLSSGEAVFTTTGRIGTANVLMPTMLAAYGNPIVTAVLPNWTLVAINFSDVTSVKSIAFALAGTFGFSLRWNVKDAPVTDYTPESGTTVIEALKSAAARVGAVLLFDFVGGYDVVYPDEAFHTFSIPSCKLVASAGVSFEKNWNLVAPPYVNPVFAPPFNPAKKPLPGNGSVTGITNPPVQTVDQSTKVFTTSDPPKYIQLPVNYEAVYIQHLCKTNAQGLYCTIETPQNVGDPNHVQGQNIPAEVTSNWFLFDLAGHINTRNIGGMQVPIATLDSSCYPPAGANTDIDNGNFVTSIGVTLAPRPDNSSSAEAKQKEAASLLAEAFRFVKVYDASIQTAFWGSIPLPGALLGTNPYGTSGFWHNSNTDNQYSGGFTIGPNSDPNFPNQSPITITGIVESVDISLPGAMTTNLAVYRRFLGNMRYGSATARITP